MPYPLYKMINFPSFDTKNGVLCIFQPHPSKKDAVPFPIKKVLAITGMKSRDTRGGHTHHKTHQVLLCLKGGCIVDLDNGKKKKSVRLNKVNQGILLYPYVWHAMRDFEPYTVLLSLADRKYNEKEYIRDYKTFLKYVRKR